MNIHMRRMMSHSILLNCLVIMIELLGANNSKVTAYGYVHIAIAL
jgi:K+ transporter